MIAISVVVPLFNEEDNITVLYNRLVASLSEVAENFEVVFVNDGSTDTTAQLITALAGRDRRVKYLHLSRNFGHQIALSAGLDYCRGAAVVIMDGDLQDPPEVIPLLYRKYREGFDVVYARRIRREGEGLGKRWTAALFYRLMTVSTEVEFPVDVGDFRIMDRRVVECLKAMPEQSKFLRGQIAWLGFRQTSLPYVREGRPKGTSSYSLSRMLRFAWDGMTAFSDAPLKFVTATGMVLVLAGLITALCGPCFSRLTDWVVTTAAVTLFVGGVQLLSLGIIGAYVRRIAKDVRRRPLYIVAATNTTPAGDRRLEDNGPTISSPRFGPDHRGSSD